MNHRRFALSIFTIIWVVCATSIAVAETTIYVVRHAEKVDGDDPVLTEQGAKRANDLARVLRSSKIDVCISSQFKRTRLTAEPTAKGAGIEVTEFPAGKESKLVEMIRKQHSGKSVLIAGHSNTVPAILRHFGVGKGIKLTEKDYDNLFVVRVGDDGKAKLMHLHYGAEN